MSFFNFKFVLNLWPFLNFESNFKYYMTGPLFVSPPLHYSSIIINSKQLNFKINNLHLIITINSNFILLMLSGLNLFNYYPLSLLIFSYLFP